MRTPLARRLERAFWSWQARTWDELLSPPEVAGRVDATVERFTAVVPSGVVLDAACGTGSHMDALARWQSSDALRATTPPASYAIVGLDFAAGMVERAAQHGHAVRADLAGPWPIASASVDGVLSVFTLQFFDPGVFLGRIGNCLKPGGVAMIEWPRGDQASLKPPRRSSVRLRAASLAKRASVVVGSRFGVATSHAPDRVARAAEAAGFDVIDSVTLGRSHVVTLRRK